MEPVIEVEGGDSIPPGIEPAAPRAQGAGVAVGEASPGNGLGTGTRAVGLWKLLARRRAPERAGPASGISATAWSLLPRPAARGALDAPAFVFVGRGHQFAEEFPGGDDMG